MKILSIIFYLENCEIICIDGKFVGKIHIDKIKEKFRRNSVSSVELYKEISEFCIEIHKDANQPYFPFGGRDSAMLPFARLSEIQDICDIEIECEEHKTYRYTVKWSGSDNYTNDLQDSHIGKQGNLYIKIGKKPIEKYFPQMDSYDWPWS